jgi:hypothetical protein
MLLPVMLTFINKIMLIATETKKSNDNDICLNMFYKYTIMITNYEH